MKDELDDLAAAASTKRYRPKPNGPKNGNIIAAVVIGALVVGLGVVVYTLRPSNEKQPVAVDSKSMSRPSVVRSTAPASQPVVIEVPHTEPAKKSDDPLPPPAAKETPADTLARFKPFAGSLCDGIKKVDDHASEIAGLTLKSQAHLDSCDIKNTDSAVNPVLAVATFHVDRSDVDEKSGFYWGEVDLITLRFCPSNGNWEPVDGLRKVTKIFSSGEKQPPAGEERTLTEEWIAEVVSNSR